jgi:hypothetical protein
VREALALATGAPPEVGGFLRHGKPLDDKDLLLHGDEVVLEAKATLVDLIARIRHDEIALITRRVGLRNPPPPVIVRLDDDGLDDDGLSRQVRQGMLAKRIANIRWGKETNPEVKSGEYRRYETCGHVVAIDFVQADDDETCPCCRAKKG